MAETIIAHTIQDLQNDGSCSWMYSEHEYNDGYME